MCAFEGKVERRQFLQVMVIAFPGVAVQPDLLLLVTTQTFHGGLCESDLLLCSLWQHWTRVRGCYCLGSGSLCSGALSALGVRTTQ